ncbi:extracellular solute-binding protein [Sphingomonas sp.]|uniref:extracellular solute-binding protein n=1 Tax=Sphingomonas sp. TaxID=28214 RepID=UPI00286A65C9|nr:extracellular solute-binding protein [Sphingomonas sp.]
MKLARRTFVAGLAALPLVGGCARRPSGTLEFWAMGAEAENLPTLLATLRGLPKIQVQPLPWTAAHEKLLTSFAGDSLPDLGQVGNSWIAELAAIDAILPVPPALIALTHGQFPAVVDTNRIGGRLMALPWYVDTRLQFYRRDLFARAGFAAPPPKWGDWKQALHKVKAVAGPGNYAVLMPLNESEHLTGIALSAGASLLNAEGTRGAFAAPEFREALAFYKSLYDERLAPVASSTQISNVWNEFSRGYFSVYPSGPWTIGDMKKRLPPNMQHSWATAPFPGPHGTGSSTPGGSSLVVYKSARDPTAAWNLIAQLLAPATQQTLQGLTGDLPPTRSVWTATGLIADPITDAFATQLDFARALPKVPEWERIVTEMQNVAELVVRGRTTIGDGAREMDKRADRLLEKRRWMIDQGRGS